MVIYEIYIFYRNGHCLFHLDLNGAEKNQEQCKLMFGLLFSMKSLCSKL